MCGFGLIMGGSRDRISNALSSFNKALKHRGPDGEGVVHLQTKAGLNFGFAHRRLSILDLSQAGHQPMVDASTGNIIVFNGEIYNYLELANELKLGGEYLISSSDTEVLLKAYKFFGPHKLLNKLRGMFAFAIWDERHQKVLLARDPCGIKPLFFSVTKNSFACASEAQALVQAKLVDGSIDKQALDSFLAFGSVQPPLCIYQGVKSLLPGHMLWVDANGIPSVQQCYWDWFSEPVQGGIEGIQHSLSKSMSRHLISDVPVGVFLSGGIDSTAIATLATNKSSNPIKTFTLNFPEVPEMSEGLRASAIAKRLGTEHHQIELRKSDLISDLPNYFQAMDQPSDDGLNVYLISKAASDYGIKTCMHGVGGDELFGGYTSFAQIPLLRNFSHIPLGIRKILSRVIQGDSIAKSKLSSMLKTDLSILSLFLIRRSNFSYDERKKLLGFEPPLGRLGMPIEWINFVKRQIDGANDAFATISILELLQYSANKLLPDGDVMSMSRGLELRFPLLDVDLIRCVLDANQNNKSATQKIGTKQLLMNAVPNFPIGLIDKKKKGFTIPINHWMASGDSIIKECQDKKVWGGLGLDEGAVLSLFNKHLFRNKKNDWLKSWQLIALKNWINK
jgi:asparagine synthase (glutamine-hydrolysing)